MHTNGLRLWLTGWTNILIWQWKEKVFQKIHLMPGSCKQVHPQQAKYTEEISDLKESSCNERGIENTFVIITTRFTYRDMTLPFLQVTWAQLKHGLTKWLFQSIRPLESFSAVSKSISASPEQYQKWRTQFFIFFGQEVKNTIDRHMLQHS